MQRSIEQDRSKSGKHLVPQDPKLVREITKQNGTEPAFRNAYWDNDRPGLYVDPHDATALFASIHKYDSASGWPSFFKSINDKNIECREDNRLGMKRIEVRSHSSDSHLGHLFEDGPLPTGKRYCINSAALRFVPQEDLSAEGYRDYLPLFMDNPQELPQDNPLFSLAIFAGGCFWCTESAFASLAGVVRVLSGYTGGAVENPGYEEVSRGQTGHYEAIMILYQPGVIRYETLLNIFWRQIDPTDREGQFYDRGSQYRTAIFYRSQAERQLAAESKGQLQASKVFGDRQIVTQIAPAAPFYLAEDYHQNYSAKEPRRYQNYVQASGRKHFLQSTWNDGQQAR